MRKAQSTQQRGASSGAPTPELAVVEGRGAILRRGPYRVRHLQRPDLLTPAQQRTLLGMITRESAVMFDGADTALYWDRRPDYFREITDWWVVDRAGRLAGWCAFARWETDAGPVLYIDTLGVMPGERRAGIGSLIVAEAWMRLCWAQRRSVVMAMRIQSPVILRMVLRCAAPWTYPRPGLRRSRRTDAVATEVASYVAHRTSPGATFDRSTFVVREAFGRRLYGRPVPRTGDRELDRWFDRHLDADAGDGLIAVMALTPVCVPIGVFVRLGLRARVFQRGWNGGA